MSRERQTLPVVVGWGYGVPESALAVAALEAAGIVVTPETRQMMSVCWIYAHALQGVALSVPASQAEEARAILAALSFEQPRHSWWLKLFFVLAFLLAAPPPPTGFFPRGGRPVVTSTR